jgi:hypothetical protein
VPVGLSVDVGWQWWIVTTIAAAVVVAGVAVLAISRHVAVRAIAGLLAAQGAVIAIVAPFVMTDMNARGGSARTAGSAMGVPSTTSVVHVVEHAPPPHMQTIGPVMTFANPVFDAADTKRIGRNQGYCIHIVLAKGWECISTTVLSDGQITNEGPLSDNENMSFPAAITGGTGKYAHARGWSTETPRNKAATKFDLVYHLTD